MKLKKEGHIALQSNTVFEGHEARIDEKNYHKLWDLLQDPYKNPVGAVVREYVSNSFDAHAEALFIKENSIFDIKNEYPDYNNYSDSEINDLKDNLASFDNDAVIVAIEKDNTGWYWSTEDFGVGLSEDRVKNVFCSYLTSTKENSNNVIGAFGIGSKSGLSYTDAIHIRTRYNGEESLYILRKGDPNPRLDKILSNSTSERNGTLIKIYIKKSKEYSWSQPEPELHKFRSECKKQLAYFDNVYFSDNTGINNDYNLLEGKSWVKNTAIDSISTLHICLGKVAYPIDWDNLQIPQINVPIGLKFEIGELDIIQTREDVKYTTRTKEALLSKIQDFKEEVLDKWHENNEEITEDFEYYLVEGSKAPEVFFTEENLGMSLNIQLDAIFTKDELPTIKYKYFEEVSYVETLPRDIYFIDFTVPSYVNESGLKHSAHSVADLLIKRKEKPVYRIDGSHNTKTSKYIRLSVEKQTFYFLRRGAPKLSNYKRCLRLEKYPKKDWRAIIQGVQKGVKQIILNNTKSYAKVTPSEEWLKSLRSTRKSLDNSLFNVYKLSYNNSYVGAFTPIKYTKSFPEKKSHILRILGVKGQDEDALKSIYGFMNSNTKWLSNYRECLLTAPSNIKYFEGTKNLLKVEKFKESPLFIKSCTSYYVKNQEELKFYVSSNFLNLENIFKDINKDIGKDMKGIRDYIYENRYNDVIRGEFMKSCYEYVIENDLLDKSFLEKIKKIKKYFKDLDVLFYLDSSTPIEIVSSYIYRYNKSVPISKHKKMNPNFYVNLNAEELKWLGNTEEAIIYKKTKLID